MTSSETCANFSEIATSGTLDSSLASPEPTTRDKLYRIPLHHCARNSSTIALCTILSLSLHSRAFSHRQLDWCRACCRDHHPLNRVSLTRGCSPASGSGPRGPGVSASYPGFCTTISGLSSPDSSTRNSWRGDERGIETVRDQYNHLNVQCPSFSIPIECDDLPCSGKGCWVFR